MKKFMFAAIAAMVMVSVSNVFASSKMVSNAEVAPVDTVAPETPADTLATGTPIQPQAGVEDSTKTERILRQKSQQRFRKLHRKKQPSRRQLSSRLQSSRQLLSKK